MIRTMQATYLNWRPQGCLYSGDVFTEGFHYTYWYNICISYVTSVRYVAGINHEARGRAAPEGRVIYSGNVPNHGHDISNLCRH